MELLKHFFFFHIVLHNVSVILRTTMVYFNSVLNLTFLGRMKVWNCVTLTGKLSFRSIIVKAMNSHHNWGYIVFFFFFCYPVQHLGKHYKRMKCFPFNSFNVTKGIKQTLAEALVPTVLILRAKNQVYHFVNWKILLLKPSCYLNFSSYSHFTPSSPVFIEGRFMKNKIETKDLPGFTHI